MKNQNLSHSSSKKVSLTRVLLILVLLISSIYYGKAQVSGDMVAANFSKSDIGVSNPVKTNHELDGIPSYITSSTICEAMKVDENNSMIVQIENDNSTGSEVSIVKVIANGVITQKLIFKGETMSCVEFPDLVRTKKTAKRTHNICE